jgi:hypothetical protein
MKNSHRYKPAMVRRILKAARGPNAKAPSDPAKFLAWLNGSGPMKDAGRVKP